MLAFVYKRRPKGGGRKKFRQKERERERICKGSKKDIILAANRYLCAKLFRLLEIKTLIYPFALEPGCDPVLVYKIVLI